MFSPYRVSLDEREIRAVAGLLLPELGLFGLDVGLELSPKNTPIPPAQIFDALAQFKSPIILRIFSMSIVPD
jgi:hypothetical protein